MTSTASPKSDIRPGTTEEWCALAREKWQARKHVFLRLPGGGRLHLDRPLPFVCLYRHRPNQWPRQAEKIVTPQASYAIARNEQDQAILRPVLSWFAGEMSKRFGAFLVIELWLESRSAHRRARFRTSSQPHFEIRVTKAQQREISTTITILEKSLGHVRLQQQQAEATVVAGRATRPPGMPAPLNLRRPSANTFQLGLKIRPVFINVEDESLFPLLFQDLREQVAVALKEACFEFDRSHTSLGAPHFHALGARSVTRAVLQADQELGECASAFDFLLHVTPVNSAEAWSVFKRSRFKKTAEFLYRPLPVDPELIKRKLYAIRLEEIEDPTLAVLFRRKREELDRQLTMLFDRETPRFLHGSLQLFGGVEEDLLKLAVEILEKVSREEPEEVRRDYLAAGSVARRATQEIDFYRQQYDGFEGVVEVREDLPAGILVSGPRLLIGAATQVSHRRIHALLQHEVGIHLLTFFNGASQPLSQLQSGLAGYEELQEGLATFSEYLCGGLTSGRLRLLAARVVAVDSLLRGADFVETFRLLHHDHDLPAKSSFHVTLRVYRGGGFTKDAIYLRGLRDLLDYLWGEGLLPRLLVGKIGFDHIPLVEELQERRVLKPPQVLPRCLGTEQAEKKLAAARRGIHLFNLIEE